MQYLNCTFLNSFIFFTQQISSLEIYARHLCPLSERQAGLEVEHFTVEFTTSGRTSAPLLIYAPFPALKLALWGFVT